MVRRAAPSRGDVIWADFSPTQGHEQSGRRPAVVLTTRDYNALIGIAIVCPVTSQMKGYPFEVAISEKKFKGAVLVDQIRAFDWKARGLQKVGEVPETVVLEVQRKLKTLLM